MNACIDKNARLFLSMHALQYRCRWIERCSCGCEAYGKDDSDDDTNKD